MVAEFLFKKSLEVYPAISFLPNKVLSHRIIIFLVTHSLTFEKLVHYLWFLDLGNEEFCHFSETKQWKITLMSLKV